MKMKRLFFCVTLSVILGSGTCFGQVVIQHSGATDPLTEGFAISSTHQDQELGPVLNDQGHDAWSIFDSRTTGYTLYLHDLSPQETALASANGWSLSATMKFVEPGLARLDATNGIGLGLGLDDNGDVAVYHFQNSIFTIPDGGNDYHEFSMVYDTVDATAALWVDGELRATGLSRATPAEPSGILFGNGSRSAHSHWNDATFTIVPEPATFALLAGFGALLVAGGARRRTRKCRN